MGDRDPLIEVLWEKKSLDVGGGRVEPVHVDDAIIRLRSGKCIYVQVKETAPSGGWSARSFAESGVASQFWTQWVSREPPDRPKTVLRLASSGDVTPLRMLIDVALRSATPAELLSDEASKETARDVRALATALGLTPDDSALLGFLKSLHAEQLPSAEEIEGLIIRSIAPFGTHAHDVSRLLIRLVAESMHLGPSARSSYVKETLLTSLQERGVSEDALIGAGLLGARRIHDATFWNIYRADVVKSFRTLRVYGLDLEQAVFADFPSLFVPLKLKPIRDRKEVADRDSTRPRYRRSLSDAILANVEEREYSDFSQHLDGLSLGEVLHQNRRIGLIGGPGCGKTTTLKWLALVSALPGEEGQETRTALGLPAEPLRPLFVRFRALAERVRARGLDGVGGRVGLVAEFLAAEFEAGFGGRVPTKSEALSTAAELLASEDCVFLFDALDEVPDANMRTQLFAAVADLMDHYPQARVLVSSRPYAFRGETAPLDLALVQPLPLDRVGRRLFARQWYQAVRSRVAVLTDEEAERRAENLSMAAESMPELAENPLLLSILSLVHFNNHGLPIERSRLYDQATLAMLGHWDRDPTGRDLGADTPDWAKEINLHEGSIRRVVEHLAHDVQCSKEGGDFSEEVAVTGLSRGLHAMAALAPTEAIKTARFLLRLLLERSGLVQERSPGVFAFVHLSFQEYLAARWFIVSGDEAEEGLTTLVGDERHAEVIRFAAGILGFEQSASADARAQRLIRQVSIKDAVLAAACLLEAPRVQLEQETLERLARRVWTDCTQMSRRHLHPLAVSRLTWSLLECSPRSDDILLEFLTLEAGDHHFRGEMGREAVLLLLVGRPTRALSRRLEWVLQCLERAADKRSWLPLSEIASLLLVETGSARASDRLSSLVRLLIEEHWVQPGRGTLAARAERILREQSQSPVGMQEIRRAVEVTMTVTDDEAAERGNRLACAAANFLLSISSVSEPAAIELLVQRGLSGKSADDEGCRDLGTLVQDQRHRDTTLAALVKGLGSRDESIRRGCARVLRDAGELLPPVALLVEEEKDEEQRAEELHQRLIDPNQEAATLAALAEALWDDAVLVVWRASKLLAETGHADVPGVPQALVRAGLGAKKWRSRASDLLRGLRRDSRLDSAVRAALLDGIRHHDNSVAAAAAMLLVDMDEGRTGARAARLAKACLRDLSQLDEAMIRIRVLIASDFCRDVINAVGEFLGDKKADTAVAGACSRVMIDAGYLNTPNLAGALVQSGFATEGDQDRVIAGLKMLLDEPTLVTETRKALAAGLTSKSSAVAWGSARCLWEIGSRTDPNLPAAIVRAGMPNGRWQTARHWLVELLGQPRTAVKAVAALDMRVSEALVKYGGRTPEWDDAWKCSDCLLETQMFEAEHLGDGLVRGGLGRTERHCEVVAQLLALLNPPSPLAVEIEEKLWDAVTNNEDVVSWGAARTLIEGARPSLTRVMMGEDSENDDQAVGLVRALVQVAADQSLAVHSLDRFLHQAETARTTRNALVKLLEDDDGDVAYGAARCLVGFGETVHSGLMESLINHGLGHYNRAAEAGDLLDELRSRPLIAPLVNEALHRALWSKKSRRAWSAAAYMMDRGESTDPGVARGVVLGGLFGDGEGFAENSDSRIVTLLDDAESRQAVLNALRAVLLWVKCEHEGEPRGPVLKIAALLVLAGEQLHETLLAEFDRDAVFRRWPITPLAALARSGRVDEAREAASRLGLTRLVSVLGNEPFPTESQH